MDQLEQDQADEVLEDPAPPRGGLLQQARDLGRRLSPLPEDSWVHREPVQDLADPEATQTSDGPVDGWDSGPTPTEGSTGSTSPGVAAGFRKGSALFYGKIVRTLLAATSGIANYALRQERDDTTWLMDPGEVAGMGDPIGRIAARHQPLPIGEGAATDLSDALDAGVVLVEYVLRSLNERAERRRGPQALNPMEQGDQVA